MPRNSFQTATGREITAVTAAEMRDVDRIAVEDVGLQLLQMMENAGRALAWHVRDVKEGNVLVVAGNGGNGGGGLACARHLANRDTSVRVLLDRPSEKLTGATAQQHRILEEMDVAISTEAECPSRFEEPAVVVDALIGYGLSGEVRSPARNHIDSMNHHADAVVSLDVPSGLDATTGETLGAAVTPDRTVTLALPKTGLDAVTEPIFLADIGIPRTVYDRLNIEYETPFEKQDWIKLER